MTYEELWKLSREGTHETIGDVVLEIHTDDRFKSKNYIKVTYKSGRKVKYSTASQLPKTVREFLDKQNKHFAYSFDNHVGDKGIVVYYFWASEDHDACETGKGVIE